MENKKWKKILGIEGLPRELVTVVWVGAVYAMVSLLCMNFLYIIYYVYAKSMLSKMTNKGRSIYIRFSILGMLPFVLLVAASLFLTRSGTGEAAGWLMMFSIFSFPYFIYHLGTIICLNRPEIKALFT